MKKSIQVRYTGTSGFTIAYFTCVSKAKIFADRLEVSGIEHKIVWTRSGQDINITKA